MDGLDIKKVPLSMLRSAVTVISQDAHLFSGTVREVIDPLGQVSTDEVIKSDYLQFMSYCHSLRCSKWSVARCVLCISLMECCARSCSPSTPTVHTHHLHLAAAVPPQVLVYEFDNSRLPAP